MQYKFFTIPVANAGAPEEELNRFLRGNRILNVRPWAAVADFTLDRSVKVDLTGSAVAITLEQALGRKYRPITRGLFSKAVDSSFPVSEPETEQSGVKPQWSENHIVISTYE